MTTRLGLAVLAAALTLAPAGAAKEEPRGLRVCGVSACRVVSDRDTVRQVVAAMSVGTSTLPPAPLSAFFTVDVLASAYGSEWYPRGYYVPEAARLRSSYSHVAAWRAAASADATLRAVTRALVPFGRPRISRVDVDGRPARDPESYELLYALRGPRAREPGGELRPEAGWGQRLEHLRRSWLAINVWTAQPSPWGDGANFLWLSRRGSVLNRDGDVVRIPAALADRIRRGLSLRR